MGKPQRWNKSYSVLSSEYGVKESSLKFWAKEGHDLNNEDVLKSLVSKARNKSATVVSDLKPRRLILDVTLGLNGSLQRLREAELELSKAYVEALTAGSGDAFTLRKEWLDVCESLRRAEKDSPEVAEANKKTVTIDEVEKTLLKLFIRLRTSLESLPTKVTKEVPHEFAATILNNVREEIQDYIEQLFRTPLLGGEND